MAPSFLTELARLRSLFWAETFRKRRIEQKQGASRRFPRRCDSPDLHGQAARSLTFCVGLKPVERTVERMCYPGEWPAGKLSSSGARRFFDTMPMSDG